MVVISVLNQKGGSGKTTIATHLSRAFQLVGYDVLLIDSDPQGSARDWAAVRVEQSVPVVGIDRPTIERDIKAVSHKDLIVIDGAPQAADLALAAAESAGEQPGAAGGALAAGGRLREVVDPPGQPVGRQPQLRGDGRYVQPRGQPCLRLRRGRRDQKGTLHLLSLHRLCR